MAVDAVRTVVAAVAQERVWGEFRTVADRAGPIALLRRDGVGNGVRGVAGARAQPRHALVVEGRRGIRHRLFGPLRVAWCCGLVWCCVVWCAKCDMSCALQAPA